MNELKTTALQYAERGYFIIPLQPNGKRPHRLAPHGAKSATNDPQLISRIWKNAPAANIGIVAGFSRFHIIDVDVKGGDGFAELDQLQQEHGALPQTATVYTPSGGVHYYFRTWGDGLPSKKLSQNIDTRGVNAYVVAPPSVVDGKAYAWGDYRGVALLPTWARDMMTTAVTVAPDDPSTAFALSLPTSPEAMNKANAYARLAIDRICSDIKNATDGTRHETYRDTAVRLVSLKMAKWHTVDFEPDTVFMSAVRANPIPASNELLSYAARAIATAEGKAKPARPPKLRPNDATRFIPIGAEVTLRNGTRGIVRWFDKQSVRVGRETVARAEVVAW